jgi:TDG/mug DNA glycosylase family protein
MAARDEHKAPLDSLPVSRLFADRVWPAATAPVWPTASPDREHDAHSPSDRRRGSLPGPRLRDIVPPSGDPPLTVLFCGINPGKTSEVDGLYFSPPGNRFWPVLYHAGFTPHQFSPQEQFELPRLGYGIASLVPRPTTRATDLSSAELQAGLPRLTDTVQRYRPHWIGFLGVTSFRVAFHAPRAEFGPQPFGIGDSRLWVLPNPSGLNRGWSLDRLIAEYRRLYEAGQRRAARGERVAPAPSPSGHPASTARSRTLRLGRRRRSPGIDKPQLQ